MNTPTTTPTTATTTTGKRRGRKRKCETPIALPRTEETDNLRITNATPEYCSTPVVFGDITIFSKKDVENVKASTTSPAITPLLPLLAMNNTTTNTSTGNNTSILSVMRPPLPVIPRTQTGLGSNVNFDKVIEKGVQPSTGAACWWCCHPFEWHPLSLPVHHDEKRNKYKVSGNFCSWNCMKAFNNSTNSVNKFRQHQHIHNLFRKIVLNGEGKPFPYKHIPLAPNRWSLKLFGGVKTIDEFRRDCVLLDGAGAARLERSTVLCVQAIEPVRNFSQ